MCVGCSQPQLSHSHQAQPNYFGFLTYAIAEVVGFNAQPPKNKRVEIDFIPHIKKLSKKSLSTTRSVLVSLRWFPGIGQGVEAAGCRALRPMRPRVLSKSFRCVEAGARDSTTAQTIHFYLTGGPFYYSHCVGVLQPVQAMRLRVRSHAPEIIRLTIQTAAESDSRSKSGALTKMSFCMDIARGNTGGPCWYDVSATALAGLFRLACHGLTA